ncbi:aldose epimerase family protein [Pseudosulfitobacter sp. DSM 107133]|uniref:aldose epimerase family protein n=1 Tax=Pseudosulfitobacter sp. DSM 107133 TaxID=2883100 RepID=UPI000DF312C8|nr:aldose epimerase family protein [Pseudosulfitobacter sp. DSM 107133]UOA27100.1 Aldose 1-epimerase [Pseudosulfitobacter sp. DSM 107133]
MKPKYIEISNGPLRARLLAKGAALGGLWHSAVSGSLVLGYTDDTDLGYMGALVGPVANRVGGAVIEIDGTRWQMHANEADNCLHSGDQGIHARVWEVADQSASSVTFSLTLQHGECGLPGLRRISACYTLKQSSLRLDITANSDRKTVMNIAHHPYWNLAAKGDIRSHDLLVHADTYLPVKADKIPTGEQACLEGLGLAGRTSTPLVNVEPMDHNLCLASTRSDTLRPAACLTGPNGMQLTISTTEPGLQVYDGAGLSEQETPNNIGAPVGPYAGIAMEPQGWPDAPAQDGFPSIMLHPDDNYRQSTLYVLKSA